MPSAEPRRFTADELLHGAPLDQFIRILFALGEEEQEQEQEVEQEQGQGQGQPEEVGLGATAGSD